MYTRANYGCKAVFVFVATVCEFAVNGLFSGMSLSYQTRQWSALKPYFVFGILGDDVDAISIAATTTARIGVGLGPYTIMKNVEKLKSGKM